MYAWEHAFTEEEVRGWMEEQAVRYQRDGFSYFAAMERKTGELIGVIGPLVETVGKKREIGVAYILDKTFWGRGYAVEGARASMEYAFSHLGAKKVIAQIRPENLASQKVAQRLGMKREGEFVKHYRGRDMVHWIYSITAQE